MNEELILQKQKLLDKIEDDYYNRLSPHYKDNIRYKSAVKTIENKFKDEIQS